MFISKQDEAKKIAGLKTLRSRSGVINQKTVQHRKVAIMYSGGMDSTVLLAELRAKHADVTLMSYEDNSLATLYKKGPAIEKVLQHYGMYDKLVKIRLYEVEHMRGRDTFGFIPGWKYAMQIAAMAHCQAMGIDQLFLGYNGGNYVGAYLDELPENVQAAADLYNKMYGSKIEVKYPYFNYTKGDMVKVGAYYDVPFKFTISCRQIQFPGLIHCGECEVCRRRKESFIEAKLADPTDYMDVLRSKI